MFEFAKELFFDEKALGFKRPRNKSLIQLLQSPAIMVPASGVSLSTSFSTSNPNELSGRLKLLLQEKRVGNISDILNEKLGAMFDKVLEYKCISTKQHRRILYF